MLAIVWRVFSVFVCLVGLAWVRSLWVFDLTDVDCWFCLLVFPCGLVLLYGLFGIVVHRGDFA